MPSNTSIAKLNENKQEKSHTESGLQTRLQSKPEEDKVAKNHRSIATNNNLGSKKSSSTSLATYEDDQDDIIAQNNLLIEAGAAVAKANWIPVNNNGMVASISTVKNSNTAKKQSIGNNAIQIQWSQNDAKAKRNEHHSELETKLIQAGGQVTKQLERQRLVTQAMAAHDQQSGPNRAQAVKSNAINMHTSNVPKMISNTDSNAKSTFKPKVCIRAGFDAVKQPDHSPRDYKKDATIGDSYKFLNYPEADSSSILFHSLQGDLLRKRNQISGNSSKFSIKSPESPVNDVNYENKARKVSSIPESEETATEGKSIPIEESANRPASTLRMDSNSVTDLSQFYYHAPEPSFLERMSDKIYGYLQPPQPHFWKPDRDALKCANNECKVEFDWPFVRRHHCRKCGDVFCYKCSSHTAKIYRNGSPSRDGHEERICSFCFDRLSERM